MVHISQRPVQAASNGASVQQCSVDVAHRGAQLIVFVDESRDGQGQPLSWAQVAYGLVNDRSFCQLWNQTWADLPFDFEWKPVPIHPYTATTHPFFAVVFPAQFRAADPSDFQPYLQAIAPGTLTTTFLNHAGDAKLLIPQNTGDYGHIAAFCRTANSAAQRALWWQVGKLCSAAIAAQRSVWCNTHGHGVPWLHVRFDSRLKYSAFPPRGSISANSQAIWYKRIYRQTVAATEDFSAGFGKMESTVRAAVSEDEPILWTMLMHAACETSLAAVKNNPALSRYVQSWGRAGDLGVVAEQAGMAIGAAWLRLSSGDAPENRGYGYVDAAIPELAIAVIPEHRGEGVGTMLLEKILGLAQAQFSAVSLSVRADNPAVRLYERVGFVPVADTDVTNRAGSQSFTMLRTF